MWIRGWSLDDFGHLHHVGTEGLGPGLNVVVGPNESGKTTMLHFLRWVLFGFPHGATSEVKRYRPASGDFGGRVMIGHRVRRPGAGGTGGARGTEGIVGTGGSGETRLVVERHFGQHKPSVLSEDGSAAPGSLWGELVGTTGRELFETVFAIGIDELTGFDDLDTDEVREQIYAAGIVGRGRSARQVLEELETRRTTLLSSRRGRIRELHGELTERTGALTTAIEEARSLPARRADLEQLHATVGEADAERARLRDEQEMVDRLIETWADWVEARAARTALEELPPALQLPTEPTSALQGALDSLEQCHRSLEAIEAQVRRDGALLDGIHTDDELASLSGESRRLDRLEPLAEQRRQQIPRITADIEHQRTLIERRLRELGAGWTRDTIPRIDTSVTALASADEHAKALRRTVVARDSTARDLDAARGDYDRASVASSQARARALDARSPLGAVHDREAARNAALELADLLPQLMREEVAAAGDARVQELAREMAARPGRAGTSPVVLPALLGGAVLCLVGAVIGFITESPVTAGFLAMTAVGLAALAWVATRERTGLRPTDRDPTDRDPTDRDPTDRDPTDRDPTDRDPTDRDPAEPYRSDPDPAHATSTARSPAPGSMDPLGDLRDRVALLAEIAGLPQQPTPTQVRDRIDALGHLRSCEFEFAAAERTLESQQSRFDCAEAAHRAAEVDLEQAREAWRSWRAGQGLGEDLRAEDAVGFLDRVRSIRELVEQLRSSETELLRLRDADEAHRGELGELLTRAGMHPDAPGHVTAPGHPTAPGQANDPGRPTAAGTPASKLDPVDGSGALSALLEQIEGDYESRRRADELRGELAQHEAHLKDAEAARTEAKETLAALLHCVGAADPAEYRRIVEVEQERAQHRSRIEDFELMLSSRFGDAAVDDVRERLATGDLADWKHRADELRSAEELAAARHDEAVRAHQDASVALGQLEASADVSTAALAVESTRSELDAAIEQWTVATLAHRAIDDTLRRFETERQPEVVRTAAESFGRITTGRYTAVIPEDGSLKVQTRDGRRLDASRLSRGATEQLYLAMRFGLALSHSGHNTLPLILDDVLVNADPHRREGLAAELHRVAERLQVLLFTCHPTTAELLCAQGERTTVLEMNPADD